jgi:diaminopropionate ammonia-lyase
MTLILHRPPVRSAPPDEPRLSFASAEQVRAVVSAVFRYAPTPLHTLPELAAHLDLASVTVKDEGQRLGLRSFKALGGAYAVIRLVMAHAAIRLGRPVVLGDLPRSRSGTLALSEREGTAGGSAFRDAAASLTFACATDGNHGQSVAAGARLVGSRAVIFVHAGVSQSRRDAIARFGAEIRVVQGSYDDAVAEAARQAEAEGWTLLSDTTWPGYEEIPRWVMQGYTLIAAEVHAALERPPTHVFLQAGVGGFAAALASAMAGAWPDAIPRFVIVEPERAACLLASARAGRPVAVDVGEPTLMSMLECYEPSLLAWRLLDSLADAFLCVAEADAIEAMRVLAFPRGGDTPVLAGESGAAGLAGLLVASRDPEMRKALGLTSASRVLLINTESATDESRFAELVGSPASAVRAAARDRTPNPT